MKREAIPIARMLARFVSWATCFVLVSGCTGRWIEPRSSDSQGILGTLRPNRQIPKSMDRIWRPDLTILPFAEFDGSEITIRHVRDCRYRSEHDYDVRHYDLRFQLQDVRTIDFIVVPFRETTLLAHTMLSFGLANGQHFAISVEARLDEGESYSPLRGASNRFELMYVIADERDVIPLRTNVRNVEVYLYRGRATPDQVQDLLVDMLARANKLQREPEFYDTLRNNCTTNLVQHVNKLRPGKIPFDWRVILPGHSDRLAYELGLIETIGGFEATKAAANITWVAKQNSDSPDLSARIRALR
ncbi:hypothetical protein VN12_15515 [Pirellula sp. SH-Sr6A]|uniref:Lnb N-terminal periplasmic domain-containing protein n=1 Tax=Pirellula sp. SH-Sr6A TaxID=1632865 RepID=UPI00078B5E4E|nr:DUF4105 domain-containing protein [Pirellula sp. SH-Sr6A]AMV33534.1 hypothetical protein VN12_15515 [Pirellula sp. SH-Sr6A]